MGGAMDTIRIHYLPYADCEARKGADDELCHSVFGADCLLCDDLLVCSGKEILYGAVGRGYRR